MTVTVAVAGAFMSPLWSGHKYKRLQCLLSEQNQSTQTDEACTSTTSWRLRNDISYNDKSYFTASQRSRVQLTQQNEQKNNKTRVEMCKQTGTSLSLCQFCKINGFQMRKHCWGLPNQATRGQKSGIFVSGSVLRDEDWVFGPHFVAEKVGKVVRCSGRWRDRKLNWDEDQHEAFL